MCRKIKPLIRDHMCNIIEFENIFKLKTVIKMLVIFIVLSSSDDMCISLHLLAVHTDSNMLIIFMAYDNRKLYKNTDKSFTNLV